MHGLQCRRAGLRWSANAGSFYSAASVLKASSAAYRLLSEEYQSCSGQSVNLTTLHPAPSFKCGVLLPQSGRNLVILVMSVLHLSLHCTASPSQWPCGLRCDTAAAHLLGMCVRNPPGISD